MERSEPSKEEVEEFHILETNSFQNVAKQARSISTPFIPFIN